jgi:hypothetical protein
MGVGSKETVLHGGWVGAGVAGICVGTPDAASVAGAHALRKNTKTRKSRGKMFFFMRKNHLKKESESFTFDVHPEVELQDSEITDD